MKRLLLLSTAGVPLLISVVAAAGAPERQNVFPETNSRAAAVGLTATRGPARSARQLYSKYCASCHGRDGSARTLKARFNHARNIADAAWQDDVSDERIFNSIMNGRHVRGDMPAFGKKLSEQEIDSLVTFVRDLRK